MCQALVAQVAFPHLVDIERHYVHGRVMVGALPSVTVQEPVNDVLGVGVFEVRRDNCCKLGTMVAHRLKDDLRRFFPQIKG